MATHIYKRTRAHAREDRPGPQGWQWLLVPPYLALGLLLVVGAVALAAEQWLADHLKG